MNLIKRGTIDHFARKHPQAAIQLANWVAMVRAARWTSSDHLQRTSSTPARPIGGDRVVFEIHGNDFRLICSIVYARDAPRRMGAVYVKFFGTHAEYDRVDAHTVEYRE